jgi:hypothetical protein
MSEGQHQTLDDLWALVQTQQERIEELERQRQAHPRAGRSLPSANGDDNDSRWDGGRISRRGALKAAAVGVAGAAAMGVVRPGAAQAARTGLTQDDFFTALGVSGTHDAGYGFGTYSSDIAWGVLVQGDSAGVYGESLADATGAGFDDPSKIPARTGVMGWGDHNGVIGQTASGSDNGVWGNNTGSGTGTAGTSVGGDGVYAQGANGVYAIGGAWDPNAKTGYGVYSLASSDTTHYAEAVHGHAPGMGLGVGGDSDSGKGVWGNSNTGYGVYGSSGTGVGGQFEGVAGVSGDGSTSFGVSGSSNTGIGVNALSASSYAVYATTTTGTAGIYGSSNTGAGGKFEGEPAILGTSVGDAVIGQSSGKASLKPPRNPAGVHGYTFGGGRGVAGSSYTDNTKSILGDGTGVSGESGSGTGVSASSRSSYGVFAESGTGTGVYSAGANGVYAVGGVWDAAAGTGYGVYGLASSDGKHYGEAVHGRAPGIGVGVGGDSDAGIGVWGQSGSGAGVRGSSTTGAGVSGGSEKGPGLRGDSTSGHGVTGVSTSGAGAYGFSSSAPGVSGGSESGPGVSGKSTSDRGGVFFGGAAQIRLIPATTKGKPTSGVHQMGDMFLDKAAALFICTKNGTPGTWVKVTTA